MAAISYYLPAGMKIANIKLLKGIGVSKYSYPLMLRRSDILHSKNNARAEKFC
jgi:hypothetical protein